jgi:hypothetical protein
MLLFNMCIASCTILKLDTVIISHDFSTKTLHLL